VNKKGAVMTAETHPVEREQLMLISTAKLAAMTPLASPLTFSECADCSQWTADLPRVSSQMLAWNV